MAARQQIHARAIAVLVMGYLAGLIAYPNLPGPFLDTARSARVRRRAKWRDVPLVFDDELPTDVQVFKLS